MTNESMSDTPRTDAVADILWERENWPKIVPMLVDHAKTLERELALWKKWAEYATEEHRKATGRDLQAQGGT